MTTTTSEDLDLLVSELFAETHGLRMKYEEFSQYTEAKIAEFVDAKQTLENLLAQRTADFVDAKQTLEILLAQRTADFVDAKQTLEILLAQRTQDLATSNEQRTSLENLLAQLTQDLAISNEQRTQDLAITSAQRAQIQAELVSLTARVDKLISQRNKARHRVKFLESSRGYRYEQRLRRLVARLLLRK